MATYTENYNLEKPAQSDLYNIDVFNENADKIDEALGDKAENQSLAPIESSATAGRNYSVGQQFVYNGLLYEATSAIASGGTITPGSNCARTTVAEELSALNDSLSNIGTMTGVSSATDFEGYYLKIGRVCFFSLSVTKDYTSWTLGSIPVSALFSDNIVAYDFANSSPIYIATSGNSTGIQLRKGAVTQKTSISGCFLTE